MNEPSQNGHQSQESGGIGGTLEIDKRTGGRDIRLIRRAIERGWNVPDYAKKVVVDELTRLVAQMNRDGSKRDVADREIIGASKALIAADANDVRIQLGAEDNSVQVNVGVQVNGVPITHERRIEEAMALLDAGRARAVPGTNGSTADEVRPGEANGKAD